MRTYDVIGRLALAENPEYKIDITVVFDKDDNEYSEIIYGHVMTNSDCYEVRKTLVGWSEVNEEDNKKWIELIERIERCDNLIDYFACDDERDIGTLLIEQNGLIQM